jgi:hypothetical protein
MLLSKFLTSLFQIRYDTLLFQIKLFHFGVIPHHLLQINLEMVQIIMGFLVELIELNIFLLQVFNFPNMFCFFQLIGQVLVLMLDLIHFPFDYD